MESLRVVHGLGGLRVWPPICAMLCGPSGLCRNAAGQLVSIGKGTRGVAFDLGHASSSLLRFCGNAMGQLVNAKETQGL